MSNNSEGCTLLENAIITIFISYKQYSDPMKCVARDGDFFLSDGDESDAPISLYMNVVINHNFVSNEAIVA